jgi:hypothetical protein
MGADTRKMNLAERSDDNIALEQVTSLFEKLHEKELEYCHWKSNEHLQAGLNGETDLDVLFDSTDKPTLEYILKECGFQKFIAVPYRTYKGIEDYIANDEKTGKLIHLHLHYQLTLGEKFLKGYHLPWDSAILSDRILEPENHTYISDPNWEMLLLLLRQALKIRLRDWISAAMGRSFWSQGTLNEFAWLRDRMHIEKVCALSAKHVGSEFSRLIAQTLDSAPGLIALTALKKTASRDLHSHKMYTPLLGITLRITRELQTFWDAFRRKFWRKARPAFRYLKNGGIVIAFVGPDGAGKSSLLKAVTKWLSWKVDVYPLYFGSGDGPSSLIRKPLLIIYNKFLKRSEHTAVNTETTQTPEKKEHRLGFRVWARFGWAIVLASEKRSKIRNAWKAKNAGMIVICDRYLQNQVMDFNDGPLLSRWTEHPNHLVSKLANWERSIYAMSEKYAPDLLIRLRVNPEIAFERKPEMSVQVLQKRMDAVSRLQYPESTVTVELDANQPLDRVIIEAKSAIWNRIAE